VVHAGAHMEPVPASASFPHLCSLQKQHADETLIVVLRAPSFTAPRPCCTARWPIGLYACGLSAWSLCTRHALLTDQVQVVPFK
jgi:hypothetical protein